MGAAYISNRGAVMNVISFHLWGNDPLYVQGAVCNARLAHVIYPGWQTVFAVEMGHPVIPELVAAGARVQEWVDFDSQHFWRFAVAGMPNVDTWIIRDCDSRLNVREKAAVDQWMASKKTYHIMADHWGHLLKPIMAGMWGGKKPVPGILDMIQNYTKIGAYGEDEDFLTKHVWPLIRTDVMAHGYDQDWPEHPPLPEGMHFVGEPISAEGEGCETA
jgi:hypothetical protein